MSADAMPAQGLFVEIIHGGDAAMHQRRVQEFLTLNPTMTIAKIIHSAVPEVGARTGVSFSTMVLYRMPDGA